MHRMPLTLSKDYCFRLQQQITQNNPEICRQVLRHVDGCEFWKGLYEKLYHENKALKDKVRLLEERQRVCEQIFTPNSEDQGGRSSGKRPAGFDEVGEWLDDEGYDEVQPIGDDHLRLSSYSKFLL
jgi:hypothetical protein